MDAHAQFELARIFDIVAARPALVLLRDNTKATWTVDIHCWICWLEVIQEIREQSVEFNPHAFADPCFLGDGHIHIPTSEAMNAPHSSSIRINSQD